MSNRMGRSKIKVANKKRCIRCDAVIDNPFRTQPWCDDCSLVLQGMLFNGEDVLEMVVAMMPPTPPRPVMMINAWTVLNNSRRVLQHMGILLEDEEDDKPEGSSPILVG